MIPTDILIVIAIVLIGGPPVWLAWRQCRWLSEGTVRERATEDDDSGDQGGHPTAAELHQATVRPTAVEQHRCSRPKAPHIGCGLPVGASEDLLDMPEFLRRQGKAGD